MKYYRVKKEYDNVKRYRVKNGKHYYEGIYVGGELYTEKEVERMNLNKEYMEVVEAPRNCSYWFFGARFNTKVGGGCYEVND